jgi:hypothetical protein
VRIGLFGFVMQMDKFEKDFQERRRDILDLEAVVVGIPNLFHMVWSFKDRSLIDLKMVTTDKGKDKFHVVIIEVFDDFTKVSFIGGGYIVRGR